MAPEREPSPGSTDRPAAVAPAAPDHGNNFDALRLAAAWLVMVSHQYFFLGRVQPAPLGHTLGELAVMVFFTLSGYLVTESWYRDPHILRFVLRRMLRIWPALAAATLLLALAGVALSTVPPGRYFGHDTIQFITRNLQLRQAFHLPGVFDDMPGAAVNGSWWTIRLETKCYLYLAGLGLLGLRRRGFSLLALAACLVLFVRTLPGNVEADAARNLYVLYAGFFFTGVCARQYRAELVRAKRWGWLAIPALLAAAFALRQPALAEWALVPAAALGLGTRRTPGLRAAGRFGDLSYGTYLYAFFVQQAVIRAWPGTPSLAGTLLLAMIATSAVAWVSWHVVERPALRLKRQLRRWFPDQAP
ncbi:MAG: acyltransferase [Xanthomonadaceae bacterium]|nr:acyltransferase [Xanthomonadaceae bacterium]